MVPDCIAPPRVFNHRSARADVRFLGAATWSVSYSGVLSSACFSALRHEVLQATQGARSMLLRMDGAMTLARPLVPAGTYRTNRAPAVVVVRPDQYDVWAEYANLMACAGVTRAVVLQHDLALAHRLLQCFAGQPLIEWRAAH